MKTIKQAIGIGLMTIGFMILVASFIGAYVLKPSLKENQEGESFLASRIEMFLYIGVGLMVIGVKLAV